MVSEAEIARGANLAGVMKRTGFVFLAVSGEHRVPDLKFFFFLGLQEFLWDCGDSHKVFSEWFLESAPFFF